MAGSGSGSGSGSGFVTAAVTAVNAVVTLQSIGLRLYDTEGDHRPQEQTFERASSYADASKLVALSETGALLDPARLEESTVRWSWFMLWSGHFAQKQDWNSDAVKRAVYESDFVITLDELPDLRN